MSPRFIILTLLLCSLLAAGPATGLQPTDLSNSHTQQTDCTFPLTTTDATNEQVFLPTNPTRVVALTPSDSQILWDINASHRVVGMPVSPYTAYLENHSAPKDITGSDGVTVDIEQVVALEPDLVIAGNITNRDVLTRLRDANLTVYHFPTATSINDIVNNTRTAGELTGECEGATERVEWMNHELETINTTTADQPKPLVFYAMGDGWTAGSGTFQHEILTTAGAENLAARANITGWKIISEEFVVNEDPEWIVYSDTFDEPPLREGDRQTTAVETNQTIAINAHYLNQPGPRVILAINELVRHFHPEAYDEAQSPQTTRTASQSPESIPTQPGLTLLTPIATLAIFVLFLLFRHS